MVEHIEKARTIVDEIEQEPGFRKEEEEFFKEGEHYLKKRKAARKCSFCEHESAVQVDNSEVVICIHCFRILNANVEQMKKFLGC